MFMKKDKPELFELLKTNKSKLNPTSSSGAKEEVSPYTASANLESAPIPYNQPSANTSKVYPKLKMPFPTNIKAFHPVTPKPKEQAFSRSAAPERKPHSPVQEKKIPLNYRKFVLPSIIIITIIIVSYLILSSLSQNKQPTTPEQNNTIINNNVPITPEHFWSNRLAYYKDNADGNLLVHKRLGFLTDKGIKVLPPKKEQIQGVSYIAIYVGKYHSLEEAKKEQPKLKKLHHDFRNLQAIELGEK
jgi:hypothetical protein